MSVEGSLAQAAGTLAPCQGRVLGWRTGTADRVTVLVACLILGGAFALALRSTNPDVAWLLSVGERWLAGERLYVDVIEVNPPASVLIYMPAVVLARLLGWSSDFAVALLTTLGCAASAVLSHAILSRGGLVQSGTRLVLWGALAILAVLPLSSFAQREHIATLAALPWLAALAARSEGRPPVLGLALLAGLGGGVAMSIKPMFALGFAGPLLFVAVRQGWRSLVPAWDLHVAWAVTGAYGLSVLLLFPAFAAGPLGWVLLAYVPARHTLLELLVLGATTSWLGLLGWSAMLWRGGHAGALAKIATLSSIGFGAVYLLQGKGWAYQAMPAILLAGLAGGLGVAASVRTLAQPRSIPALAGGWLMLLLCAAAVFATVPNGTQVPGLAAAIARLSPHPRMMAISSDISDGHPLVRELGGRWVGSFCSNWITAALAFQREHLAPAALQRLEALSDHERDIVTSDLETRNPDVVLLEDGQGWSDYIAQSPALSTALGRYQAGGHYGTLTVLVRKPSPGQEQSP